MATDGPDPIPCSPDVFEMGTEVMRAQLSSNRMEQFVLHIRAKTEERVDWHYEGGIAVVKVFGNVQKVRDCIKTNIHLFVSLRKDYIAANNMQEIADPNKGYVLV